MQYNYTTFNYVSVDDRIYGIPGSGDNIVCIDIVNKTQQLIGDFSDYETYGNFKWSKGVLADNGKIYAAPYNANAILCIDPTDDSYTFIGDFSAVGVNDKEFFDGFLAPNGKIYYMGISRCLCLDPSTETYAMYTDTNTTGGHIKHILAPNGKIYGVPYEATSILCMDTTTDTIDSIDTTIQADGAQLTDVFLSGTDLYMVGKNVLKLNTLDDSVELLPIYLDSDFNKFIFFNNKIYGFPDTSYGCYSLLCIDLINSTYKMFGNLYIEDNDLAWYTIIVGSDNKIYGIPQYNDGYILCLDPTTDTINLFKDNTYGGVTGVLANNDNIYIVPSDTNNIIKLSQTEYIAPPEPPSSLSAYVKVDNVYQPIISMYVKTDGIYKQLSSMFAKINNGWVNLLSSAPSSTSYLWFKITVGCMYTYNMEESYWYSYIYKILLTNEKITDFENIPESIPESIINEYSGQAFYEASDPNFEEYDGPTINMFLMDSYSPYYEYYKEYEEGDEEIDHNITYIFKFNTPTTFNYIYLFLDQLDIINNAMGDISVSNNSTDGVDGDWTLVRENVIVDNKITLYENRINAIEIPMNKNEDVQIIRPFF